MLLRSFLYISRSKLSYPVDNSGIRAIVDWSRRWNALMGITGALVLTERHFAQFLEGPPPAVVDLMRNIRADTRHSNVDVIEVAEAEDRQFGGWCLAYAGPDRVIDRELAPHLQWGEDGERRAGAERLRALLKSMAAAA